MPIEQCRKAYVEKEEEQSALRFEVALLLAGVSEARRCTEGKGRKGDPQLFEAGGPQAAALYSSVDTRV